MIDSPLIIYVDDDEEDLSNFQEAVGEIAEVKVFERGGDMLKMLPSLTPKIIFVDLNMPLKSGYEIIQEIRSAEQYNSIPIVVLSTASDNISVTKSRELGANYFIQKPTTLHKLAKSVRHALNINWEKFKPTYGEFIHKH